MKIAEHCIDEGNAESENLTKAKTRKGSKLISTHPKVSSIGLKRSKPNFM